MTNSPTAFDYVVVGGGTAGCALAARLSEDPTVTVCLLEAGGMDRHPFVRIPAAVLAAVGRPRLNWGFETTPQAALNNRRIPMPRGRVLGGSGSINGMVYHRGYPRDYEDWAMAGATGWSYSEVLPYFTRSENNEDFPESALHGRSGPLNVRFSPRPNPMTRDFIDAVRSLKYPACGDFSGPDPEGVGMRQATIRNGRRDSTARGFLRPALARPNLTLLIGARAQRILFSGKRAVGIELLQDEQLKGVSARREVVLTMGAIQTPQLLLCSGVGDGAELSRFGIAIVHHLPGVGRNLHDHLAAPVRMKTSNTAPFGLSWRTLPRGLWSLLEYALAARGPLASNVFESVAFLRTDTRLDRPDFQFVFQPSNRATPEAPLPIGHGFAISPVLLYPKSRGRLSIDSPDPFAAPLIDPGLLSDAEDLPPLIRAVQLCRDIFKAAPFARYHASEVAPGPNVRTVDQIAEFVRATAATVHHPVGTCRMGTDSGAVVDPKLRVIGLEGLRVADASIFPSIIGGNTNAVTVMVAEKAADLLLNMPARPTLVPERAATMNT
jgi:choline dehydrogenase-like flavoprotein